MLSRLWSAKVSKGCRFNGICVLILRPRASCNFAYNKLEHGFVHSAAVMTDEKQNSKQKRQRQYK